MVVMDRYDEALAKARAEYEKARKQGYTWLMDLLEGMFPKLKESEDERIRKEIIGYLTHRSEVTGFIDEDKDCKRWIAYLEKQKESLHISETCKENADSFTDEDERTRRTLVEYFGLGVQLDFVRGVPIQKIRAWLEKQKEQKYLYYDQGFVEGMRQSKSLANAEIIVSPLKMTNKVSVSEELYEHIRETCACIDDAMSSETLVDITDYLEMADKSAQAAFDMLEKQKEQKPAEWSEEDERMLSRCIKSVECSKQFADSETYKVAKDVEMNWLNSLPERFNLQQKVELSEEDEDMYKMVSSIVHGTFIVETQETQDKLLSWLKSLRPRPSWKPSEEQMGMLLAVINDPNNAGAESCHLMLQSLFADLQKLLWP